MRMSVLAGVAFLLAGCATSQTPANTSAGQQASGTTATQRDAPIPPALRTPRQRSGVGWPDIGYRPSGY